jgi:hypothetical protein
MSYPNTYQWELPNGYRVTPDHSRAFNWQLIYKPMSPSVTGNHGELHHIIDCSYPELNKILRDGRGLGYVRRISRNVRTYEVDLDFARHHLARQRELSGR